VCLHIQVKDGAFNPEEAKKLSAVRFHNSPKDLEATNKVIDICAKEGKNNYICVIKPYFRTIIDDNFN
jgi:hypothetical protein